jgi:hypothetical protein
MPFAVFFACGVVVILPPAENLGFLLKAIIINGL